MLGRTFTPTGLRCLLVTGLISAVVATACADVLADRYILGYATALLEQQFKVQVGSLQVKDGVILIQAKDVPAPDHDKIIEALKKINGVVRVDIVDVPANGPTPAPVSTEKTSGVALGETTPKKGEFLPSGHLFDPLIADPRTPHFSAAYQDYRNDAELNSVAAVSLGMPIGLYEGNLFGGGRWQAGIEGVVFSIFDLDAPSSDLVNSDYWLGLPFSSRWKNFSSMLRLYHQSSHLGDEYLLRNRTNRVNVSYEGIDLRLSYDLFKKVARLYGGVGYILRKEPENLERKSAQAGVELSSPWAFLGKHFRPVAGLDVQTREESDWDLDWSARAGLQFESEKLRDRKLQLMAEYYRGSSPNGQFFDRRIEYWAIGLHFYFD